MGYNEHYFDIAYEQLNKRRAENSMIQEQRRNEILKKIPEYRSLEESLASTGTRLVRLFMEPQADAQQKVAQLEQENRSIQSTMSQLLKGAGYPENYLEPIFSCEICCDKGTVNGKWCECFRRLMLSAAAQELNAVSPLKLSSFGSFSTELYPEAPAPIAGMTQRSLMKQNFDYCQKYAERFGENSESIFMQGGTGLGKTHLSLAIADEVLKKGFSVIYGSVPELLRTIEKEYYGKSDNDTIASLTGCDLLILDDLGAEMEKPLYTSLLYEVINGRICRKAPLIVSTNLAMQDIQKRYQDRIWSRLYSFKVLLFCGTDVRRALRSR